MTATGPADELRRFDPAIPVERAATPPASWYVDPAFADMERRAFREAWVPVARVDQVATVGVCVTGTVAGEPWVVVRGEDGALRGFSNVCRHHAAGVVTEAQAAAREPLEELVCPYHGWTYALDGSLKRAPRTAGIRDFDVSATGLRSIAVTTCGELVLMRIAGDGPLPGGLAEVASSLDAMGAPDMRWAARRTFTVECNWKVFIDNYLDGGYHVPTLHNDLASQLDLEGYATACQGDTVVQTCGDTVLYAWVWPNLMINRYGAVLDTNVVLPLAPDRCAVVFDWWFDKDLDDAAIGESLESSAQVQREDRLICESVQRGLSSSAYDVGRYAPRLEHGMHAFHRRLHAALMP